MALREKLRDTRGRGAETGLRSCDDLLQGESTFDEGIEVGVVAGPAVLCPINVQ